MNKINFLIFIISILIYNTSFSQITHSELLEEAKKHFSQGQNINVVDVLTQYIEVINTNYEAFYIRGQAYYKLKMKPAAESDLKKATELHEKLPIAYNILGLICQERGENQQALLYFTKVIDVDSKFADAFNNRGFLYGKMGTNRLALEDLSRAVELDPKNSTYYYNRGYIYVQIDQYDKAVEDFTKSIKLNSNFALAYMNRGICYYQLKKYGECVSDMEIAIEIDRKFADEANKFIRSAKSYLE